jgi:pimeloyl-ACP methyl ester carboxylesterase
MRYLLGLALFVSSLSAATLDGMKIHWTSAGKGNKTVILVHGWTCDETTWVEQVPALSAKYRVITMDLPGHGKSDSPKQGKLTMALFARAVDAVRAEAKADRVVLVGHSMGTPVILEYVAMYPEHTAGLVFVDGLVRRPGSPSTFKLPAMTGPEAAKNRETMIRGMFSSLTTPAMQKHIMDMMMAAPEKTAAEAMQASADVTWRADVLKVPVLGVYANNSTLGDREFMKERFPALEYTMLPGTGHFLMLEKPAEFNGLLVAFLEKTKY